jgi:serine/threonine protein kinase
MLRIRQIRGECMNAEALIGTALGTCTLQQLIGQGGMGAVYLAQQSRPRRQVAVKVLMPMTPLAPNQLVAFLERFRRETDAAASLEHPNIVPVHEYGEQDGLAYLVMPYISGGTLRDEMEREGQLPLSKAVNYLEQLASALDFAHERGVIHRDIKPANILLTPTGRLLLTDFGLVKVVSDGQTPQIRLTGAGAPVGTPDYMAPEQVIGEGVDGRADQYSLGVILYQMLTGTTPFQGETPMQIAARHLQSPPPSPRSYRPDLPPAAEQVILRVLAKSPANRYPSALDFAAAFRLALEASGVQLNNTSRSTVSLQAVNADADTGTSRSFRRGGLFDPSWRTTALPAASATTMEQTKPVAAMPAAQADPLSPRPGGLLSKTGRFPRFGVTAQLPTTVTEDTATPSASMLEAAPPLPTATGSPTGVLPVSTQQPGWPTELSPALKPVTTTLTAANPEQATSSTVKLTGPVKVVQVPVAGQPGRFVTGLLPVVQTSSTDEKATKRKRKKPFVVLVSLLVVLALVGSGAFWFVHYRLPATKTPPARQTVVPAGTPNVAATATAQAVATASANVLLADPLNYNSRNWPTNANEFFAGNAYHIVDTVDNGIAVVLAANPICVSQGYSLTMYEVKGDDASINNSFGQILRFSQKSVGGKKVTTFYSFEVVNTKGGEYRFYKYDDSKGGAASAWTLLWHHTFGSEYHQGQGTKNTNTLKVFSDGKNFTFMVNGKKVGNFQDGSLTCGTVGMLVNLKGTEVAFSNLLITRT